LKRNIHFIDEDEAARRANARALRTLLDNSEITISPLAPFATFGEYNPLVANSRTAAFVLDQRMKGSGDVTYNGTDLARYLRGIDGKVPIYILTGHPDESEDFAGSNHLVEYVIGKDHIDAPDSEQAKIVKARILRHLDVFNDVRDAQEQRFHDLLLKSLKSPLTAEEQKELDDLESAGTTPILAAERDAERALSAKIAELRNLLPGGSLNI